MLDLSNYSRNPKNKNYRTLAYVDPCGMQVEWRSIECLRGLPLDMWVLVPTGLGVNRLLKNNGKISDIWLEKLEKFLGLSREEIEKYFVAMYLNPATYSLSVFTIQLNRNLGEIVIPSLLS